MRTGVTIQFISKNHPRVHTIIQNLKLGKGKYKPITGGIVVYFDNIIRRNYYNTAFCLTINDFETLMNNGNTEQETRENALSEV